MPSWREFEIDDRDLAELTRTRIERRICYLATVRRDGSPRVFPTSPFFGDGALWLFVAATSPKRFDLRNDGRFALHASVEDTHGGRGEAHVIGTSSEVTDPGEYERAVQACPYDPQPDYLLFELSPQSVTFKTYGPDGAGIFRRWNSH